MKAIDEDIKEFPVLIGDRAYGQIWIQRPTNRSSTMTAHMSFDPTQPLERGEEFWIVAGGEKRPLTLLPGTLPSDEMFGKQPGFRVKVRLIRGLY